MRCPILIGREGPVSLIAGAVRRLRGDAGGAALVMVGEAGVGKTRLAEYLSDAAARAGIEAVHGGLCPRGSAVGCVLLPRCSWSWLGIVPLPRMPGWLRM